MNLGELPVWFRLGVALELMLAALIGGFGTFAVFALLPYGPNKDRMGEILIEYAATFLFLPLAIVLCCAYFGARFLKSRHTIFAAMIAFAPAAFAPWLFVESLK